MTTSPPSGVVTFLFTDIEGSTRRLNYSDDRIARDALSSVRSGVLDLTGVRKTLSPSDAPDGTTETQSRVRFAVATVG
jgi:hypothetical protein